MKVYSPPVALSALSSFCHQCHRSCNIVGTTVLVRRVHARMCLYARDENRFNWMCTRCGRRRSTAHIVSAPFNCSLGVYAQGGGESSLRHTNTHQRFISVST